MLDKEVLLKAEKGCAAEMYEVANCCLELGMPHLAFFWMEKSARRKYAPATYALSCFYADGTGTGVDVKKSLKLLKKSAKAEYPDAVITLAGKMINSKSKSKKVVRLAKKTATIDTAVGEYYLGMCYYLGLGAKKNIEHARAHLTLSAVTGSEEASCELLDKEFALSF
ncbi:MAG: hypothetical protein ACI4M6_02830 [Christensenellaceae bacterium]